MKELNDIFSDEKIEYFGLLSLTDCKIINEALFERRTAFAKSIISFLIPYYNRESEKRNISLYAVSYDYHIFIKELTDRIIEKLKTIYPEAEFCGMGDHSPIDEVHAAAACGLGILGDNNCLINEKYGSYVFIAEIFCSIETDRQPKEIVSCPHCGICATSCPSPSRCLSDLTQQKGEVDSATIELMRKHNTAWGCDICQQICPLNSSVQESPIEFFKNNRIAYLTPEIIANMSDKELEARAYGWRKRKTIERNIKILFEQ